MFTLNCRGRLLTINQPIVMGIINATPDSFFSGSRQQTIDAVLLQAEKMIKEGATILDIGGQSTRPGSEKITAEEESARVCTLIDAVNKAFPGTYISIDTYYAAVAKEAVSAADDENNETQEDIFHLSYTKLIQNAEKGKDYRSAIRLMFLQTLKLLSDTNTIHYQPDYTNFDYLQQLKPSKYHNEFFAVMRNYEYVWYGKFDISTGQYTAIKNKFLKLQHTII